VKFSWRLYAFLTFFLFGLTNFILGFISEKTSSISNASLYSAMILWVGMGFMGFISFILFRGRKESLFEFKEKKHIFLSAIAGISLSVGMLTLKLGFFFDPMSKGPIVAIVSTNSLIVALLSLYFLKERLNRVQIIGFLIIVFGILMISLSNVNRASLTAIFFGFITMLLFALTNYILKFLGSRGLNSVKVVGVLWLFSGLFGVLAIGIDLFLSKGNILLLPDSIKTFAFLAGISLGFGMLTLKIAVSKGPAGPIVAIAGSNAILVTALDYIFFGQMPIVLKITGMLIAILGIFIATYFKR